MSDGLEAQRRALASWYPAADEALKRRDWRAAFAGYPRLDLQDQPVPWVPAPASLRSARLLLVGSGGLSAPGQGPFDASNVFGDPTWRALPANIALETTTIAHDHYDHGAAERDRNAVYPLERLRAMAEAGEIGGLTSTHFSFMGYLPDWAQVMDSFAPALAARIAQEQPDAVLLVPV